MNQVNPTQVISTNAQPQQVNTQNVVPISQMQPQETVVHTVPNMQEVMVNAEVQHVDPMVHKLSTGWTVRFKRIPKAISDELVTSVFSSTNIDDTGNINIESGDRNDQIKLASQFQDLNSSIIASQGVELLDERPADNDWLPQLQFSPTITSKYGHIDWSNPSEHAKNFLFIKYYVVGQDDIALLSEYCLNNT